MSVAHTRDYSWLPERQPDLAEAYCLCYVRGLSRTEALCRLGADERALRTLPIAEAVEAGLCAEEEPPLTAHALALGDWTVIVEPTGCRSARPQVYRRLSAGTELVCLRVVMGYRYEFRWVADGTLRLFFDARLPDQRGGSSPDRLAEDMRDLDLTGEIDPEETDPGPALLALADRVTGVRLRPGHLSGPLLGAELDAPVPAAAR
ncbi:hypothetical protein NI17_002045 [Thermobifida halotolerans]|uniref:Uncharacterized protein n=1 Tax=Thermobifida halotolerans TaxID=483545 RepID=A0A399G4R9_9ACTN|nr:DUF6461 domain-containing protein [Thermobifida halotolerans]UOE20059.1 hypothetical protein NI17_002045 [Thermobifida halotolerans]